MQGTGNESELHVWREKFLVKVDEQEQAEREYQEHIDILKSGLIRISLAADGIDLTLDSELAELRHMLKNQASNFRLQEHLQKVKQSILLLDEKKQYRIQQAVNAYQTLNQPLEFFTADKKLSKELKNFQADLPARMDNENIYSQLLHEFSQLHQQLFETYLQSNTEEVQSNSPSKPGLLQSFFQTKKPIINTTKTLQKTVTPDFDLHENLEDVFDGERLQRQQIQQQNLKNTEASPLGKPKSFNASAIHYQRQKYQGDAPLNFEAIADNVSDLLNALYQQLDASGQALDYIHCAEAILDQGLECQQLIPTLENTSQAIITLQGQNQKEFSHYLLSLNESLKTIQQHIAMAADNNQQSTQLFDDNMQQQIACLQEELNQAESLDHLKQAVQKRTSSLLNCVNDFKEHSLDSEQSLSSQLCVLQERICTLENEAESNQQSLQEQRTQALTDPLTQLPNRAAFNERLAVEVNRWQRYQSPLSLLMVDIDLFKQVNDNWGHQAGDKVLQIIATNMKKRLRETDFIARFGGEEFIFLFSDSKLIEARVIAEGLRESIEACPFHFKNKNVNITISLGLASFKDDDDFNSVFQRADQALYLAKHSGRNQVKTEQDLTNNT